MSTRFASRSARAPPAVDAAAPRPSCRSPPAARNSTASTASASVPNRPSGIFSRTVSRAPGGSRMPGRHRVHADLRGQRQGQALRGHDQRRLRRAVRQVRAPGPQPAQAGHVHDRPARRAAQVRRRRARGHHRRLDVDVEGLVQTSSVSSSRVTRRNTPTLLTSRSRPPSASAASSTKAAISPRTRASAGAVKTRRPAARSASASSSAPRRLSR